MASSRHQATDLILRPKLRASCSPARPCSLVILSRIDSRQARILQHPLMIFLIQAAT
jgi:hypothetical protein